MWKARLCLIITALIWGSTFIAQRLVADTISPAGYTAVRFALGTLTMVPLLLFMKDSTPPKLPKLPLYVASSLLAFFLFMGSALQQYSLMYTTAGKAAFITGLYIVWVPIAGLFVGQRLNILSIFGIIIAVVGADFMTLQDGAFTIAWADIVLLISTFFWVAHILLLNIFSKQYPAFKLATTQFLACAILAFVLAQFISPITIDEISNSWFAILWGGSLSVAIGFTGQLLGQRYVPPTQASLLMSLEMVFAAVIGFLVLGETMNTNEIYGVIAISIGVVLAQLPSPWSIPPIRR